jgi:rhamnosyltransferase
VIIPTYQAAPYLERQLIVLAEQEPPIKDIVIVDSSSTDRTRDIAERHGARVIVIDKREFDHGGTRTMAGMAHAKGDLLLYLTQDAMPVGKSALETLIRPLELDPVCGAVFGRQIPRENATPFASHLRRFNYPATSYVRTYDDRLRFGIKAAFCSNSFAAYRRKALDEVGWFEKNLVMAEDIHVCARMLRKGYTLQYVAEAEAVHSHNYTIVQDFKRYFDLGVFFRKERWLLESFGRPEGEGLRFVRSEAAFLTAQGLIYLLPESLTRAAAKMCGYRLGQLHQLLPPAIQKSLSMHMA